MAIGFVFELDDVLYPAIVSRMDRSAYENSPPPKGTPLSVGGAPTGEAKGEQARTDWDATHEWSW